MHEVLHAVLSAPGIMQHDYSPLVPPALINAKVGSHCLVQGKICIYVNLVSQIPLAPSYLGSLNSAHFLSPTRSRLRFLDGTQLVGSVARYADVVVALENELEVAKFEG